MKTQLLKSVVIIVFLGLLAFFPSRVSILKDRDAQPYNYIDIAPELVDLTDDVPSKSESIAFGGRRDTNVLRPVFVRQIGRKSATVHHPGMNE